MSTLSYNPRLDEYARLRAENEEEYARLERDQAMRRRRDQATDERQSLEAQSRYFERHFATLTGRRATTVKPRFNTAQQAKQRAVDFYGFYYGQL